MCKKWRHSNYTVYSYHKIVILCNSANHSILFKRYTAKQSLVFRIQVRAISQTKGLERSQKLSRPGQYR